MRQKREHEHRREAARQRVDELRSPFCTPHEQGEVRDLERRGDDDERHASLSTRQVAAATGANSDDADENATASRCLDIRAPREDRFQSA